MKRVRSNKAVKLHFSTCARNSYTEKEIAFSMLSFFSCRWKCIAKASLVALCGAWYHLYYKYDYKGEIQIQSIIYVFTKERTNWTHLCLKLRNWPLLFCSHFSFESFNNNHEKKRESWTKFSKQYETHRSSYMQRIASFIWSKNYQQYSNEQFFAILKAYIA